MVRKLNRKLAEAYSEDFSRQVLNDFFSRHQAASGQNILELTPVQQVNLLIIQRLYQRWQEEALRLRSPYFNFEHSQVQESLQAFMNTLSRHIQVERHALEPLLQEAVQETLRLLFNPMAFFDELLHHNLEPEKLQASLRYLRIQQALTDVVYDQVEEKETIQAEYLLAILEAGIRSGKLPLEPVEEHVRAFEQVLIFPKGMVEDSAPAAPLPQKEEATDFFSTVSGMGARPARNTPKEVIPESEGATEAEEPEFYSRPRRKQELPVNTYKVTQPEPAPVRVTAPAPEEAAAPTEYPVPVKVQHIPASEVARPVEPKPDVARPETASPEKTRQDAAQQDVARQDAARPEVTSKSPAAAPKKQDEDKRQVNTRFEGNERKPLYEKFEQKEPRSASISQKQRSSNIRHYITLNQRFMFVKELFGGDGGAFNAALDSLDACQNMREAQQWVQQHLAPKPQWQDDSEVVQEFQNVLEHRFGS